MQLQHNISLKPYNTFGIDTTCEHLLQLNDADSLAEITEYATIDNIHIIGGGSNILLTKPVSGLVLLNRLKGIERVKEYDEHVWIKVNAGEIWHEFVMHVLDMGLSGVENLALIPGTVGAAPIQNIGAYGVEAKATIETVTAWLWKEKTFVTYSNAECRFGYRDSIFKHKLKGKAFITSVVFKLNKKTGFNTSYGAIAQELEKMNVGTLTAKAVAEAVIAIRRSKLPDPAEIGNAGSFFKNPTIAVSQYEQLRTNYPDIPSYPVNSETVKLPAGWLIEQCGWKGYRRDDIGVHAKQALVLVNYGKGKGSDIWQLSGEIVDSVHSKYGIELEREVQIL